MQFIRLTVLIVLWATTAACAGGEAPVSDDAGQSNPKDAGDDTTSTQPRTDASSDTSDSSDTRQDSCGVCCPGERICTSASVAGVCADDGSRFTEQSCSDGQICEEGHCIDEPICEPGETACHDGRNRQICRPDGASWRAEACPADTACLDGECVSGAANGAECDADGDCAGGKCRCGSGEACSSSASRAYCTTTCTPGSCGPDEICVASDSFDAASYDHCLPTCDQTCPLPGMTCASLPTRDSGELGYESACYFDDVVDVGEACTSDGECTGGMCLSDYYKDVDLCTYECSGECPTGTACVKLQSDTYHCAPLCGDGSPGASNVCPLGDIWGVSCGMRTTPERFAKKVCIQSSP